MMASDDILHGIAMHDMQRALGGVGLPCADVTEPKARSKARVLQSNVNNVKFLVTLISPSSGERFNVAEFWCGFTIQVPLSSVNDWNRKHNFLKAYVEENGYLNLEMHMLARKIVPESIDQHVHLWIAGVGQFVS